MLKAWLMGAAIVVGGFILSRFDENNDLFVQLFFFSQAMAAYVATYYAPRWKFLLGMSMVLPSIVWFIVMRSIELWTTGESTSQQDSELKLGAELYLLLFIAGISGVNCGVGSVIGFAMAGMFQKKIKPK